MEIFIGNPAGGDIVSLDPEESAHCVRVLRHREGDSLNVIDGKGTLYRCTLEHADPKGVTARIDGRQEGFGAHPYHLTMAVCPTKNTDRIEWFAEKATEIGLDVLAPVIGERSERKVLNTGRLERLVRAAAKQSLKGTIPVVMQPVSLRDFILEAPDDALKLICYCFEGRKYRIPDALKESSTRKVCILIGPEGDFSPEEAELALGRGWLPVSLGASRLRTETAALVACTQVYSTFGE